MQILKVEPWVAADDHTHSGLFDCWIVLEPWEYTQGLSKAVDVEVVRRDLDTMRVTMRVLVQAQDELAAYKMLPELVSKGEDYALRYRS